MQRFLNIRNTCVRTFPSTPRVPISRLFNSRPSSTRLNISHWSNSVIVSLEKRKFHTSVWSSAEISKNLDGDTSKLEGSNAPHQSSKINESSSTDDVVRWAEQFVEREDALKLKAQKINGKALRDLDALSLERWGIPGGPASILANEIIKLKGVAQDHILSSIWDSSFELLSNDNNHVKLWHALLDNKAQLMVNPDTPTTIEEEAKALVFPNNIVWLHGNSVLFFRHDVSGLCDVIEQDFFVKGLRGVAVIGTPGIGKSVEVGNFLFYRAAKANHNVIFESVVNDTAYFFDVDDRTVHELKNPRRIRWPRKFTEDRNTLYLMDAGAKGNRREPDLLQAFTVVTASPNELHYGNWLKTVGVGNQLFLPPWTWNEIKSVLPFVTLIDVPDEEKTSEVQTRFNTLGGVVRYLLGSCADFKNAKGNLESSSLVMNSFDFDLFHNYKKNWEKIPNYIFIIHSIFPYFSENSKVAISSPYAKELLEQAMTMNKLKALGQFVHLAGPVVNFGSPRGQAMELYTIEKVQSGGLFTVRNLSNREQSQVSLPCSTRVSFADGENVFSDLETVVLDSILVPHSKRFKGFDFFLYTNNKLMACQITVKTERYLPFEYLKHNLVQIIPKLKLGPPAEVILLFTVDSKAYDKFCLITKKGTPRHIPKTIDIPLSEKKLSIPFTTLAMLIDTSTEKH